MKYTFLLLFISTSIFAAKPKNKWTVGLSASPQYVLTKVNNGINYPVFFSIPNSSSFGFGLSLKTEYRLHEHFQLSTGLQSGIHSVSFGPTRWESELDLSYYFSAGHTTTNQATVGFPISIKCKFSDKHNTPFIDVGYQFMYFLDDISFAGLEPSPEAGYVNRDLHFLTFALGYHIDIKKGGAFEISAAFKQGIKGLQTSIYESLGDDFAIRQSAIQIEGAWFFTGATGRKRH